MRLKRGKERAKNEEKQEGLAGGYWGRWKVTEAEIAGQRGRRFPGRRREKERKKLSYLGADVAEWSGEGGSKKINGWRKSGQENRGKRLSNGGGGPSGVVKEGGRKASGRGTTVLDGVPPVS